MVNGLSTGAPGTRSRAARNRERVLNASANRITASNSSTEGAAPGTRGIGRPEPSMISAPPQPTAPVSTATATRIGQRVGLTSGTGGTSGRQFQLHVGDPTNRLQVHVEQQIGDLALVGQYRVRLDVVPGRQHERALMRTGVRQGDRGVVQ